MSGQDRASVGLGMIKGCPYIIQCDVGLAIDVLRWSVLVGAQLIGYCLQSHHNYTATVSRY